MVTALAWDNARAFNKWFESVRLLQQSCGNNVGVVLAFLENMPTPWRRGNPPGNGVYGRPHGLNAKNEWPYDMPSQIIGKEEKQPVNIAAIAVGQETLQVLERSPEFVGSR